MRPRKTKLKKSKFDDKLIVQDIVVVSKFNKKHTLAGEFNNPHKFGGNKINPDEDAKHLIGRLYSYISELILFAAHSHKTSNCKPDSNELQADCKNNVTRLITNEFFFYTECPLPLKIFEILINQISNLAATLPENLHLVLATFAVKSPSNKLMNVAVQIECGKNPIINLTVKNHPSSADPIYFEGDKHRIPIKNIDITEDHNDPTYHINIKGVKYDLTFNNVFLCKTAGNISFYSCIEICLDHNYRVGIKNFDKALRSALLSSKKIDWDQLTTLCIHTTVSNTIAQKEGCMIGNFRMIDPYYAKENADKALAEDQISKFIEKDKMFGTEAKVYTHSPQEIHEVLFRLALLGAELGNKDILKYCLSNGLDINTLPQKYKSGETNPGKTLLMTAIKYDQKKMVKWLLKKGANPNLQSKDSMTALHYAVLSKNSEILHTILKNSKVNIDMRMSNGNTPLHLAIILNDINMIHELLKLGANPNIANYNDKYPLHLAIESNSKDSLYILKLLLHHSGNPFVKNSKDQTPLHCAMMYKNLAAIYLLMGTEKNNYYSVDSKGRSLFHYAAKYGIIEVIDILIKRNVSPNQVDDNGNTPLHLATKYRNLEFAEIILTPKNVNQLNKDKETALHIAARNKSYDIAKLLIANGADIEIKNARDKPPLLIALQNQDKKMMEILLVNGANPNATDSDGYTILHYAIDSGDYEMIKLLLAYKADVNQLAHNKTPPIKLAIINGNCPIVVKLWDLCKIDINAKDKNGQTLLHYAANLESPDIVRFLLSKGANPSIENKRGFTPRQIAKENNNLNIVKVITAHMVENLSTSTKSSTANIRTKLEKDPVKHLKIDKEHTKNLKIMDKQRDQPSIEEILEKEKAPEQKSPRSSR